MAATTAIPYNEEKLGKTSAVKVGDQYDPEAETVSRTFSIQTGNSSGYRTDGYSRLSRHSIKIKTFSSFPNLLDLYHQPIREESNLGAKHKLKEKKKKDRKEKTRKKDNNKTTDVDDYHERRARHEMRVGRMEAIAREQLVKFDMYMANLNSKVEKQREDRKKYNETLQERLREQEEMERKKLRLQRGEKHVYIHDRKYLKTLPESNFCKMTRLADELQKRGVLRTHGDMEKFWSGYGRRRVRPHDIFAPDSWNSVNYPSQWMTMRKPEIKVDRENDDDVFTDTHNLRQTLPPLEMKKRKKKKTTTMTES